MTDTNPQGTPDDKPRTFYEEISVAGNQLVESLEKLIKEGNIRKVILKDANGRTLLEMPLTLGVAAGAGLTLFMPLGMPLAIIAVVAGYMAKVRVIVERYENPADAEKEQKAAEAEASKTE